MSRHFTARRGRQARATPTASIPLRSIELCDATGVVTWIGHDAAYDRDIAATDGNHWATVLNDMKIGWIRAAPYGFQDWHYVAAELAKFANHGIRVGLLADLEEDNYNSQTYMKKTLAPGEPSDYSTAPWTSRSTWLNRLREVIASGAMPPPWYMASLNEPTAFFGVQSGTGLALTGLDPIHNTAASNAAGTVPTWSASSVSYVVGDVVKSTLFSPYFRCKTAHTSSSTNGPQIGFTGSISLSRTGSSMTVTWTGHRAVVGDYFNIAGASDSTFNGDYRITGITDANTVIGTNGNSGNASTTATTLKSLALSGTTNWEPNWVYLCRQWESTLAALKTAGGVAWNDVLLGGPSWTEAQIGTAVYPSGYGPVVISQNGKLASSTVELAHFYGTSTTCGQTFADDYSLRTDYAGVTGIIIDEFGYATNTGDAADQERQAAGLVACIISMARQRQQFGVPFLGWAIYNVADTTAAKGPTVYGLIKTDGTYKTSATWLSRILNRFHETSTSARTFQPQPLRVQVSGGTAANPRWFLTQRTDGAYQILLHTTTTGTVIFDLGRTFATVRTYDVATETVTTLGTNASSATVTCTVSSNLVPAGLSQPIILELVP